MPTEGMHAESGKVVWHMDVTVARQLAALIEASEPDPFHLRHHLSADLRQCANEATQQLAERRSRGFR